MRFTYYQEDVDRWKRLTKAGLMRSDALRAMLNEPERVPICNEPRPKVRHIHLRRDHDRDIRFTGNVVVDSNELEHRDIHPEGRWTVFFLFKTDTGIYIPCRAHYSDNPDDDAGDFCVADADVQPINLLSWLKFQRKGKLSRLSKTLFDRAAYEVDEIRDVSILEL